MFSWPLTSGQCRGVHVTAAAAVEVVWVTTDCAGRRCTSDAVLPLDAVHAGSTSSLVQSQSPRTSWCGLSQCCRRWVISSSASRPAVHLLTTHTHNNYTFTQTNGTDRRMDQLTMVHLAVFFNSWNDIQRMNGQWKSSSWEENGLDIWTGTVSRFYVSRVAYKVQRGRKIWSLVAERRYSTFWE